MRPFLSVPDEATFIQVAPGLALSLFDAKGFDGDAGRPLRFPFTIAHNVGSKQQVDDVGAIMIRSGRLPREVTAGRGWGRLPVTGG